MLALLASSSGLSPHPVTARYVVNILASERLFETLTFVEQHLSKSMEQE